jgi:hypothetical protein
MKGQHYIIITIAAISVTAVLATVNFCEPVKHKCSAYRARYKTVDVNKSKIRNYTKRHPKTVQGRCNLYKNKLYYEFMFSFLFCVFFHHFPC